MLPGVGRPHHSTEVSTHQQVSDDCLPVFEKNRDGSGCVALGLQNLRGSPVSGEVVSVVEFDVVIDWVEALRENPLDESGLDTLWLIRRFTCLEQGALTGVGGDRDAVIGAETRCSPRVVGVAVGQYDELEIIDSNVVVPRGSGKPLPSTKFYSSC